MADLKTVEINRFDSYKTVGNYRYRAPWVVAHEHNKKPLRVVRRVNGKVVK